MPCKRIEGDGWSGFVCTRGGSQKQRCSCGRVADYLCDFPLRGKKEGQTCDKPLCVKCAKLIKMTAQGGIHYCPAHQRMAEKEKK